MYQFTISDLRTVESAGFCLFDHPCIHPSRNLKVHDFIYMIDGSWKIGLGNETFEMNNDDVLILPANIYHYGITPCPAKTRTMFFTIYSHPHDKDYDQSDYADRVIVKKHLNTSRVPNIKRLFEKIIQTKSDQKISTAYINTLLFELSELSAEKNQILTARAIHDFLVLSDRILTNSEVAAHFHISKKTAETLFKSYYNVTIHKFIIEYKLNESKRYLINYPDMKIISIAHTLGFYDEFHFSKSFTRAFGITPSAYRKQNIP